MTTASAIPAYPVPPDIPPFRPPETLTPATGPLHCISHPLANDLQDHREARPPPVCTPDKASRSSGTRLPRKRRRRCPRLRDRRGPVRQYKSAAERMSKDQREKKGYNRITAYCIADGMKMKLLAGFSKREHNVHSMLFDEAIYVMYHLPLLPGYSPSTTVRSSTAFTKAHLSRLSEAEENGCQVTPRSSPRSAKTSQPIPGLLMGEDEHEHHHGRVDDEDTEMEEREV